MVCNLQQKSPLTVKVTKREKGYQNASLAEYIQQSWEFHVFSSVFLANTLSYCKPFPAYLPGLYIEVEEKARVRKRNISRWHVVRSSFFWTDVSNYGWVTCSVANSERCWSLYQRRQPLMSFLSSIYVISVREKMKVKMKKRLPRHLCFLVFFKNTWSALIPFFFYLLNL